MSRRAAGGSAASRSRRPARIGIYGGTFNPIHVAHLILAEDMAERFRLDSVLFVPSGRPPHKRGRFPTGMERLLMVRLAIEGNERFEAIDLEVRRRGPSYTVETLRELAQRFPPETEFYFLLGMDAFREITTWHEADRLGGLSHFVVFPRPDFPLEDPRPYLPRGWRAKDPVRGVAGTRRFPLQGGRSLFLAETATLPISATEIRRRVRSGRSIRYLVAEGVREHIMDRKFYNARSKGG